jgi:4-hydroxybenzoate polyprenyltransferase
MTSPPSPSRLRAWLELARISNLPTIWTNVLVGSAIAAGMGRRVFDEGEPFPFPFRLDWIQTGAMLVAMSLFYIGGMVLNDIADMETDTLERPGRPIPSGRVSRSAALLFTYGCFFIGLLVVTVFKAVALPLTLLLLIAIMAYDFLHKRFAASVLIMGLCRSLVVLACATGEHTVHFTPGLLITSRSLSEQEIFSMGQSVHFYQVGMPMALTLGAYVVGITVIARGELEDRIGLRKWLSVLMPVVVLLLAGRVMPDDWRVAASLAFVLSLWLARPIRLVFARPPKTLQAVLAWLSGICIVDAYFLALLDAPLLAAMAVACFLLTEWGHRKILGT